MKKRIILLALIAVSFIFSGFTLNKQEVSAKESSSLAKCATREFNEEFKYSKAVFVGKVLSVMEKGDRKVFTFQIEKYWKGVKTKKIEINVYENTRYQFDYETGKKYLVYAKQNDVETGLWDMRCSRSREISDDFIRNDLKKLGKGKK
jgi:hypothetical protein